MKIRCLTFAIALIGLTFCTPKAQLGPKDGTGLPPLDLERVKVGDKAPNFTLENHDRRTISLSDFRGNKKVVLVFYRGHW